MAAIAPIVDVPRRFAAFRKLLFAYHAQPGKTHAKRKGMILVAIDTSRGALLPPTLILVALPLVAFVALALAMHARSFDPAKMIGCYRGNNTPLVRITADQLIVAQHPELRLRATLTQNNIGYVLDMAPGVSFRSIGTEYTAFADPAIRWLPVDVRKKVPELTMQAEGLGSIRMPRSPCS